jgi:hypothetical protein
VAGGKGGGGPRTVHPPCKLLVSSLPSVVWLQNTTALPFMAFTDLPLAICRPPCAALNSTFQRISPARRIPHVSVATGVVGRTLPPHSVCSPCSPARGKMVSPPSVGVDRYMSTVLSHPSTQ